MNPDSHHLTETLDRWKDGTISSADLERLIEELESPESRTLLLDAWIVGQALPEILSQHSWDIRTPAIVTHTRILRNPLWRTFGAAAAGLLLGLFSASYVFGKATLSQKKVTPLLADSFETGTPPGQNGVPAIPNQWSGDFSRIVPQEQGVRPKSGNHMLQFRRADHEGKGSGFSYCADLYRIIPVPPGILDGGESVVTCEAHLASIPFLEQKRYGVSVVLSALDALPEKLEPSLWVSHPQAVPNHSDSEFLVSASARRSLMLESAGMTWQKVELEMRLPKSTRYLLASFHLSDHKAGRAPKETGTTEFPGHFLDAIQVNVVRTASAP